MDKLIELFLKEPNKEFHVREISKLLKKSPTTISKFLKIYTKKEILISETRFNHLLFKANTENPEFKRYKLDYNLSNLNNSGLVNELTKRLNHPEAIILFGSYAKAEDSKNSDIDLLIITNNKKDIDLKIFEKKLEKNIQLHIHSNKEIENMKTKNKELLNSFVNGIIINGYWELFK